MSSKKQLFGQSKSNKAQTGLVTLTLLRCRHYGPRIFARYFWYTGVLLRDLPSRADHSQVRGRLSNNNISLGLSSCELASWVGYYPYLVLTGVELFYIPTYHFFTTRLPTQRKKLRHTRGCKRTNHYHHHMLLSLLQQIQLTQYTLLQQVRTCIFPLFLHFVYNNKTLR